MARCWCCDRDYGDEQLTHLGAHPEVVLCLDCAFDIRRRAVLQHGRYTHPRSPAHAARVLSQRVRDSVIRHEWHRKRGVGPLLRWIDRRLR